MDGLPEVVYIVELTRQPLVTRVLPQQTRVVNDGAENDRARHPTCTTKQPLASTCQELQPKSSLSLFDAHNYIAFVVLTKYMLSKMF